MAKLDSQASIEKIVSNTVVNGNETEKKTRATREPKIDFNHDEIDLKVYRAILRATARSIKETLNDANRSVRNGILIGDLLTSMEKFSKVEATNRAIVQESIISLQERKLVRSIDGGKFQFINATDGGFYNEIIDRDDNGVIVGKRIRTNFFTRNGDPLGEDFRQHEEMLAAKRLLQERNAEINSQKQSEETEQTVIDDVEEWEAPELEFADDDFNYRDNNLNSDMPEVE